MLAFSHGRCLKSWLPTALGTLLSGLGPVSALAGQSHADLSVSVVVTPSYFVPSGRNTVELTVYNAGPDAVDSGMDYSIAVYGDHYVVTHQPPPYEVLLNGAQGCWAERILLELVYPNNDFIVLFAYNFGSIPAGESLTCTYEIQFAPEAAAPFPLAWEVETFYSNINEDPDPSNDTFSYTLGAAPSGSPTPVPADSSLAWMLLGIGLIALAFRERRSVGIAAQRRMTSTTRSC